MCSWDNLYLFGKCGFRFWNLKPTLISWIISFFLFYNWEINIWVKDLKNCSPQLKVLFFSLLLSTNYACACNIEGYCWPEQLMSSTCTCSIFLWIVLLYKQKRSNLTVCKSKLKDAWISSSSNTFLDFMQIWCPDFKI